MNTLHATDFSADVRDYCSSAAECARVKRLVRRVAGAAANEPVVVVPGASPPKGLGAGGHYVNKSGDVIRHPNAYRRAWGKPTYVPSTLRVSVGRDWLLVACDLKGDTLADIALDYVYEALGRRGISVAY